MPGLYKNKTVLSHELIILLIIDYLVLFFFNCEEYLFTFYFLRQNFKCSALSP